MSGLIFGQMQFSCTDFGGSVEPQIDLWGTTLVLAFGWIVRRRHFIQYVNELCKAEAVWSVPNAAAEINVPVSALCIFCLGVLNRFCDVWQCVHTSLYLHFHTHSCVSLWFISELRWVCFHCALRDSYCGCSALRSALRITKDNELTDWTTTDRWSHHCRPHSLTRTIRYSMWDVSITLF